MADCCCGTDKPVTLIYACSGAANTGYLADRVARGLAQEGAGKMTCLAAVGAGLSGFLESAKSAGKNLLLDGCPVSCGKRVFENLSIPFEQHIMTDHGVEKGKTQITGEIIEEVKETLKSRLGCGC
ncbi:MAG TPA: putative zinc-binding protein [Spirochaetia bacterium]|nr:putative zinc-binding protein [Spirochaetia bacterium]